MIRTNRITEIKRFNADIHLRVTFHESITKFCQLAHPSAWKNISDSMASNMHTKYTTISTQPIFLDKRNLLIARVVYKVKATRMRAKMVYSIDWESIVMNAEEFVPMRIVFMNHGMPRDNSMFMVLAPRAFDTPIDPSPVNKQLNIITSY